jgi:hydroxyethylthiazole kinase
MAGSALPADHVAADVRALRERAPLVHCMTNVVVTGFTANVLLAAGASPAMVEAVEEAGQFAAVADALLINVGTLTAPMADAMRAAVMSGTAWVLDPVAVGAIAYRTKFAVELLGHGPAIVRGNASEILSLAGADNSSRLRSAGSAPHGAAGKGVDSLATSDDAIDAAKSLAQAHGCVVAVSGEIDYITDGDTVLEIRGGDPLMTRVTGVGCALGALMAAFTAVSESPLRAAAVASAMLAKAAECAAAIAGGPGSFAVALLDELAR